MSELQQTAAATHPTSTSQATHLIEQTVLDAHAESLRAQGLRVDAVIFSEAIFNEPLPSTRRITVGNTNIVLESDGNCGVPKEVLEKLPRMLFENVLSPGKSGQTLSFDCSEATSEHSHDNILCYSRGKRSRFTGLLEDERPEVAQIDQVEACEQEPAGGVHVDSEDVSSPEVKEQSQNFGGCTCEICQTDYEGVDEVMLLPCKHFYHGECIERWLVNHNTCPKCRFEVAPCEQPVRAGSVVITRTTTIEWVPVTQWIPAATTTVEVVSDPRSEFELVTTVTSRPLARSSQPYRPSQQASGEPSQPSDVSVASRNDIDVFVTGEDSDAPSGTSGTPAPEAPPNESPRAQPSHAVVTPQRRSSARTSGSGAAASVASGQVNGVGLAASPLMPAARSSPVLAGLPPMPMGDVGPRGSPLYFPPPSPMLSPSLPPQLQPALLSPLMPAGVGSPMLHLTHVPASAGAMVFHLEDWPPAGPPAAQMFWGMQPM